MKRRDAKQRIHRYIRIAGEFLGRNDSAWLTEPTVNHRLFRIGEATRYLGMADRLIDWLEENE